MDLGHFAYVIGLVVTRTSVEFESDSGLYLSAPSNRALTHAMMAFSPAPPGDTTPIGTMRPVSSVCQPLTSWQNRCSFPMAALFGHGGGDVAEAAPVQGAHAGSIAREARDSVLKIAGAPDAADITACVAAEMWEKPDTIGRWTGWPATRRTRPTPQPVMRPDAPLTPT